MGGQAPPPGNAPVPVPPFGTPQPAPQGQPLTQPASLKGGALAGLPSLQDMFTLPMGAPPLFPPSQSFPQGPPIMGAPAGAPPAPTPAPTPAPQPKPEPGREP